VPTDSSGHEGGVFSLGRPKSAPAARSRLRETPPRLICTRTQCARTSDGGSAQGTAHPLPAPATGACAAPCHSTTAEMQTRWAALSGRTRPATARGTSTQACSSPCEGPRQCSPHAAGRRQGPRPGSRRARTARCASRAGCAGAWPHRNAHLPPAAMWVFLRTCRKKMWEKKSQGRASVMGERAFIGDAPRQAPQLQS
jgi:hypothetical protein